MAPKALIPPPEPSKEKQPKEPSSEEEEEEEEEEKEEEEEEDEEDEEEEEEGSEEQQSDSASSGEKTVLFHGEAVESEDGNPEMAIHKANDQDIRSDSDSDLGTPSVLYKVQPTRRTCNSSTKRAHEEDKKQLLAGDSKKHKTDEVAKSSAGRFTRLFSTEDDITVLHGMIAFKDAKSQDPSADMEAFYNFIKKKLKIQFSRDQLKRKVKRLNTRFLNAIKKCQDGEDPVYSNPNEDMLFLLSKKIWGASVGSPGNDSKKKGKSDCKGIMSGQKVDPLMKKAVIHHEDGEDVEDGGDENNDKDEDEVEEKNISSQYPFLSESFDIVAYAVPSLGMSEYGKQYAMKSLSLISHDKHKLKELNEKWRQLTAEEIELNYKKMNLMKEQMKFVSSCDK